MSAFGGGLLYGAAGAEDATVTPQLTFNYQLQGSVGKAMASLPAPDLAAIVFNLQPENDPFQAEAEFDDINQETFSEDNYYCLPEPQGSSSANNVGQIGRAHV